MARNWKREWIPRAIENARTLWRKRYKDKVPIVHLWAEATKEPDDGRDLRDQSTISQIGDELDPFIDGNPVLPGERDTSLSWWLEEVQRRTYPNLSRVAIDILSSPAMSAQPERATRTCLLGVPAYHNVAANEAWCKGCGGRRVFEIMDKIWRCGKHPLQRV
jgi:hAT family protein